MKTIAPGGTLGIVGGGQLGRMLAIAAANLGYRTHIYAPEASGPARDVAAGWTQGAYDDEAALAVFGETVDVVTYEFENVPVAPMAALARRVPLFPRPRALAVAQDRLAEKSWLAEQGLRAGEGVAPWADVPDRVGLDIALAAVGTPAILKTRRFGYDGKGQARLAATADADAAWAAIGGQPAVLEALVSFEREFSVIAVRGQNGTVLGWPTPENTHRDGILRRSTVPASGIVNEQAGTAHVIVERLMAALDYVGVIAVEFFATADGPLVNEIAPRVHNSGHWTIEGAVTSQFENHVRAVLGLPLGSTALIGAGAEMTNLIGDDVDGWRDWLADPAAKLHLYGKREARPGRKMGHVTRVT